MFPNPGPTGHRLLALAVALAVTGCADDPDPAGMPDDAPAPVEAEATTDEGAEALVSPIGDGTVAGTVSFTPLGDALQVSYDLGGLGTGAHGFHVHQVGDCGPDSTGTPGGAAGGHFNPLESPHGAPSASPGDRHAGDLGNIDAGPDGRAAGTVVDSVLSLDGPTSVLGRALVIHAGADDLSSQPSGDAGARVGCGVIRPASAVAPDSSAADV